MGKDLGKICGILIILMIYPSQILSQVKTDTVCIGNDQIVVSYPRNSKVSITNYDEGFIKDIVCIEDTALMGLHYGSMVNLPFVDRQGKKITSEYFVTNDFRQTRGFYYLNGEKKFFREDNIIKYGLNLYYTNVPEDRYLYYESLLNSFKYSKNIR